MEYSKEEVMSFIETCKKNGIQDAARLYQIQAAMRAGLTINLLEALGSPGLTELQMQQIAGLAVNGFPEEEILAVCKEPERLSQRREAYYKKTYGVDQKKIYQEVFNGFLTQWQRNFNQLLKQTETLSNTLDFLKEQVRKKEQEIQAALKQTEELRRQAGSKGAGTCQGPGTGKGRLGGAKGWGRTGRTGRDRDRRGGDGGPENNSGKGADAGRQRPGREEVLWYPVQSLSALPAKRETSGAEAGGAHRTPERGADRAGVGWL